MSIVHEPNGPVSRLLGRVRHLLAHVRLRPFDTATPEGRAQERHRRVLLAALASAGAKVISVATGLISVPLTLHYLGTERYGMWMTMSSLAAILAFADLGLGNGLLSAVAAASGRDDQPAIRRYVSSGLAVLSAMAMVLLALFALAYPHVPWHRIFNVQSELARQEAGPALAVFFTCFALALPTAVVQRVQMGLQRGFMASMWQCGASVLALGGVLLAIHHEAGLPWLVLAFVGAPLLAALVNSLVFFGRLMPQIAPGLRSVSRDAALHVARTGMLFLVLQIVVAVAYASDSLVIAQMLGAAAVAEYAVSEKLFALIGIAVSMILAPLWPAYGEAFARKDYAWIEKTLRRSVIMGLVVAGVFSLILVIFGGWVVDIWVGESVNPPFLLFLGLGLWKIAEVVGNALGMFLNGANVIRPQVVIASITAFVAISLKITLAKVYGLPAIPFATVFAFCFFALIPYSFIIPGLLRKTAAR